MGKEEFIEGLGATESIPVGKPGALSAVEVLATLDWHKRYTEQDVHGKTVYVCTQCDRPVSKASRKLHAENHAKGS